MAWIHHPELAAQCEVPDDLVSTWTESGWRRGTLLEPEPWSPPTEPDDTVSTEAAAAPPPEVVADLPTDLGATAEPTTTRKKG